MSNIVLDPRLEQDTHVLGYFENSVLLLMNNALFPWFVLVPESKETEFHQLDSEMQVAMLNQMNLVARFIETHHTVDKINIATIGNIVSQLHMHIVGRCRDDICWPNVVWGVAQTQPYQQAQVSTLKEILAMTFQAQFRMA